MDLGLEEEDAFDAACDHLPARSDADREEADVGPGEAGRNGAREAQAAGAVAGADEERHALRSAERIDQEERGELARVGLPHGQRHGLTRSWDAVRGIEVPIIARV